MNLDNKATRYERFSTYEQLLGRNIVAYVCANNDNSIANQQNKVNLFCKQNNLNCITTYIDIIDSKELKYKLNLQKLIKENSNINVLITDINKLARNRMDLFEINCLCKNKQINFFDISGNELIFDEVFNTLEKAMKEIINKGDDKNLQRNINVLYVEPNKLPVKKTIKNTLEEKQKLVDGYIEYVYREQYPDIVLICNEEGKLLNLEPNRDIGKDIIFGNFLIVGDDQELGEDRSLTDEQIKKYSDIFGKNSIESTNKKIDEIILKQLNEDYFI